MESRRRQMNMETILKILANELPVYKALSENARKQIVLAAWRALPPIQKPPKFRA
jgi:hypothetical protein